MLLQTITTDTNFTTNIATIVTLVSGAVFIVRAFIKLGKRVDDNEACISNLRTELNQYQVMSEKAVSRHEADIKERLEELNTTLKQDIDRVETNSKSFYKLIDKKQDDIMNLLKNTVKTVNDIKNSLDVHIALDKERTK